MTASEPSASAPGGEDPRDQVTEQAFRVDPGLLGTPLAEPWRRAVAFSIDAALASLFARSLGLVVIVVLALLCFRAALFASKDSRGFWVKRVMLGALGGVLLLSANFSDLDFERSPERRTPSSLSAKERAFVLEQLSGLSLGVTGSVAATGTVAAPSAEQLAATLKRLKRLDASKPKDPSWVFNAASVTESLMSTVGLTASWMGLYFVLFPVWWEGATPGKRLLGIRVVQLDGHRLGAWAAFARFSGYAAGVATGLLGFAQIFWDPNRQAIHDKIASTVVIRTAQPTKRKEK